MLCPICGFNNDSFEQVETTCKLPDWNIGKKLIRYKCPNCDVIFGTLEILNESKEQLKERYQKLYNSGYKETDSTELELSIIRKLESKNIKKCLNWGAGSIPKTKQIAKDSFGIDLYSYEPFDPFAINCITNINDLEMYDAIISNNVLEHFQHPVKELITMSKYLKPNGIMIHKTACWRYEY